MAKLKNTQAIRDMLNNEHKLQTRLHVQVPEIGVSTLETQRKIGETWTDVDGCEWEQKEGYIYKKGKLNDIREELKTFPNCLEKEEGRTCKKNSITAIPQDWRMKDMTGRCIDCQVLFEHRLKMRGEYDLYEAEKILENMQAWLLEAEKDTELIKQSFKNISIPNPDGDTEKWVDNISYEQRCIEIDEEFARFKTEKLEPLQKKVEELRKK